MQIKLYFTLDALMLGQEPDHTELQSFYNKMYHPVMFYCDNVILLPVWIGKLIELQFIPIYRLKCLL